MIVDIYTHILPKALIDELGRSGGRFGLVKRLMEVTTLHDLDARFRQMDEVGADYRQIVSLPNPPVEAFATKEQAPEIARIANDAMAELVARHPDRFPAFVAALPFHDVEATLAEAERAIRELGARGIQVFTNVNGRPIDDAAFRPLFALMAEHDLPIWLHPARTAETTDYPTEKFSRYELWWCFGWPFETSLAMARLVLTGVFDRHPDLKLITHHCGGMVPFFDARIEKGLAVLGSRTREEDYSGLLGSLKRPHIEYFRMFHADTALFGGSGGVRCGLDFFGADRVVFASDAPFGPAPETVRAMGELGLAGPDLEKVLVGNAERLMKTRFH